MENLDDAVSKHATEDSPSMELRESNIAATKSAQPLAALIAVAPDEWAQHARYPLTCLWIALMLSCDLQPTLENEEAAMEAGDACLYESRVEEISRRLLDRVHYGGVAAPSGYLLTHYLLAEGTPEPDAWENHIVDLRELRKLAEQLGWTLSPEFLDATSPTAMQLSQSTVYGDAPRKSGPEHKVDLSRLQLMYGLFMMYCKAKKIEHPKAFLDDSEFNRDLLICIEGGAFAAQITQPTAKKHIRALKQFFAADTFKDQ